MFQWKKTFKQFHSCILSQLYLLGQQKRNLNYLNPLALNSFSQILLLIKIIIFSVNSFALFVGTGTCGIILIYFSNSLLNHQSLSSKEFLPCGGPNTTVYLPMLALWVRPVGMKVNQYGVYCPWVVHRLFRPRHLGTQNRNWFTEMRCALGLCPNYEGLYRVIWIAKKDSVES